MIVNLAQVWRIEGSKELLLSIDIACVFKLAVFDCCTHPMHTDL